MMKSNEEANIIRLLLRCRDRDDTAFEELVVMYKPMIDTLISKMDFSGEDVFSDAALALYKAALSYDLEQSEVTFGLYAKICVRNKLVDIANAISRDRDKFADFDVDRISVPDGTLYRLLKKEESDSFRAAARRVLSEYEYTVLLLWLGGDKTSIIAKKLCESAKSVDNAKARIMKKLRGVFFSEK